MTQEEIQTQIKSLHDWIHQDPYLKKEFLFKDFTEAFSFMTAIALVCEKMDHHPDWSNSWNRVQISLTTHDKKSITDKDFQLARKIDQIYKRQ
jgi:4a-hydroxytetrahydrobiopterin dehydratase